MGKHGRRYARHIREDFPDVELFGVVRRDSDAARQTAAELGCRAFLDYRELIAADEVDAIVVAVPPMLHFDIISCAARAGRPVLLEKPASASREATKALLAVVRQHPVPIMVAHTLRYNGVVRALLARRADIGAIRSLSLSQRFEPSLLPWIDDPALAGAGMTLHTGVHSFDLLRVITGLEADRVSCQMERVHTRNTEDSFAASLRLGNGAALATVSGARTAPGRTGHIEIAGELGTLVGDHVLNQASLVVGSTARTIDVGPPVPTVREVLGAFTQALRDGQPMPIPLEEGLRAVAIADACYVSVRTGAAAAVEPI